MRDQVNLSMLCWVKTQSSQNTDLLWRFKAIPALAPKDSSDSQRHPARKCMSSDWRVGNGIKWTMRGVHGRAASCGRWLGSTYLLRSSRIVCLAGGPPRTDRRACCISGISQEIALAFPRDSWEVDVSSAALIRLWRPLSPNRQPKGSCVVGR